MTNPEATRAASDARERTTRDPHELSDDQLDRVAGGAGREPVVKKTTTLDTATKTADSGDRPGNFDIQQ
jgi:hypothetical protein